MDTTAPAVVVGAELNGLGVVRSLARGAVRTIVIDTTPWHAAMWSRFCRSMVVDELHGRSLIDSLLNLQVGIGGRPVLFLTDETAVNTISEHRDELRDSYRILLPPKGVVTILENRARFHEFAEHYGLPVPRAIILRPNTPLAKLANVPFPVTIKPAERQFDHQMPTKSLPVDSLRDAEALCGRLRETIGELVVQEWIDGPTSNNCFALFHASGDPNNSRIFTGRKIACHANGNTTLCLAAPEVMNSLEPLIGKFLNVTAYRGLGGIEFKWDRRQRRYVMTGQTLGRTDWQEEIATLSGVNLPLAAYRHELGIEPTHQDEIDRTVAWRESSLLRERSPTLSPNTRVYDGYWRMNDPLPALFFYARAGLDAIHRHFAKLNLRRTKSSYRAAAVEKKVSIPH